MKKSNFQGFELKKITKNRVSVEYNERRLEIIISVLHLVYTCGYFLNVRHRHKTALKIVKRIILFV